MPSTLDNDSLSRIIKEISFLKSFKKEWITAKTNHSDKKLYFLYLRWIKQVVPLIDIKLPKSSKERKKILPFYQLFRDVINFLIIEIPSLFSVQFEKEEHLQSILLNYYNRAFKSVDNLAINKKKTQIIRSFNHDETNETNETNKVNNYTLKSDNNNFNNDLNNNFNKILDENNIDNSTINSKPFNGYHNNSSHQQLEIELTPTDSQGSQFFKEKLHTLIGENVKSMFMLWFHSAIINNRNEYFNFLKYLFKSFPFSVESLIKPLLNGIEHNLISFTEFRNVLSVFLDVEPYPVIFNSINYIQEILLNQINDKQSLSIISEIMDVFSEYAEYYPDYFSPHINLYVRLLKIREIVSGKKKENYNEQKENTIHNIIISSIKLLNFYTEQGEDKIDELFILIYEHALSLHNSEQSNISDMLMNALDLSGNYILEKYMSIHENLPKNLLDLVYSQFNHPNPKFRLCSAELAHAIWRYNTQKHFQLIDHIPNKREISKYLIKPALKILNSMEKNHVFSPFLLLQFIISLDQVWPNIGNKEHPQFEKKFLSNDTLDSEQKYFEVLHKIIILLKKYI